MVTMGSAIQIRHPGLNGADAGAAAELIYETIRHSGQTRGTAQLLDDVPGYRVSIAMRPLVDELFPELSERRRHGLPSALIWTGNLRCIARNGGNPMYWVSSELRNLEQVREIARSGRKPGTARHAAAKTVPVNLSQDSETSHDPISALRQVITEIENLRQENERLRTVIAKIRLVTVID